MKKMFVLVGVILILPVLVFIHYDVRAELNEDIPATVEKAESQGWIELPEKDAVYHRMGLGNESNRKFISKDHHREAVYNQTGLVRDCINMGTYNFVSPLKCPIGHAVVDVIPYYLLGNTPQDALRFDLRVEATVNALTTFSY